ncbi:MAG: AMP-binding protein [Tepidibacter sp.]|jgi:phenylacetate-coenzyme A ligase PaaK-like adenylate-forming protein|uniref:DVU_1553 family AMP-dependent CoA ligase n=1 Tax=Tepidibacter sp. TaxID=2529387 RepID=UPI0025D4C5D7|nr:AMP-binding protein [Tepidibacter sp.]MCT4507590.1 AMP-binding protein [Tepidibacter sp.]
MKNTVYEKWIEKCILGENTHKNITLEDLRKYQLDSLRRVMDYAKKNSLFYKNLLKNINPYEINSFDDFSKIPFTLPEDLRNRSQDFLCVPQHMISRIVTLKTSGTTGKQKRVFFTKNDLEKTIDFFYNGIQYLASKGDCVLILMPGQSYGSIGYLLKKALEKLSCEAIVLGTVKNSFEVLELMKNKKIDCIIGIPIQILNLAKVKMNNKQYENISLKSILLSADYVPNTIKEATGKAFNCKVFTHYGMTEMGFGGGVECEDLSGYHMREADFYFEIINPVSREVMPLGDTGEVVFTTLAREGMPLIRYRTGDYTKFISEPCKCSDVLPRMDYVTGRIEDKIKVEDLTISIEQLDEAMFRIEELVDYKAVITENNTLEIYTKSLNQNKLVNKKDIEKALYSSNIAGILDKEKLYLKHCGEIEEVEISSGMVKRKLIKKSSV